MRSALRFGLKYVCRLGASAGFSVPTLQVPQCYEVLHTVCYKPPQSCQCVLARSCDPLTKSIHLSYNRSARASHKALCIANTRRGVCIATMLTLSAMYLKKTEINVTCQRTDMVFVYEDRRAHSARTPSIAQLKTSKAHVHLPSGSCCCCSGTITEVLGATPLPPGRFPLQRWSRHEPPQE